MLGFRLNPPGPFWFEDLMFVVIDEGRRLPARTRKALAAARRRLETATALASATLARKPIQAAAAPQAAALPRHREVVPLTEPEAWALATEPLVAAGTGIHAAVTLHRAAAEQLDALSYALDRIRDELRPMMTYARFNDDTVHPLQTPAALDTSIEALLELSRRNAATRPKDRVRPAA